MKYYTLVAAVGCALSLGGAGTAGTSSFHSSTATIEVPSAHMLICPQGDGQTLADVGATITIQVIMDCCVPMPDVLPGDLFVVGCNVAAINLCDPGIRAIDADEPTDANGWTTMSGTIKGGGSDSGLFVVILGSIAYGGSDEPICLPITVVSPDIDGDLDVDIVDVGLFASAYPPQPHSPSSDFNGDGVINLLDLSLFAFHFGPPGHQCLSLP